MNAPILQISGYASLFHQTDLSGDQVQPGAFSASILSLKNGRLPMLFGHETHNPIGVWDRIIEDKAGLFVSGYILGGTVQADRTARLIRDGAVSGLSIGYRVKRSLPSVNGRNLIELELWEVSVVAFPMLRSARISQINDLSSPHFNHTENGALAYA
jgi:HK97 family phage prohead protease